MIHINIKDLHFMVKPKCTNEVKASIEKMGLKNPVVVVKTTKAKWEEERHSYPFITYPPKKEGEFYQIRFGHNRVSAYKELGYETIPAIICDTAEEAATIGKRQALWQKQTIGPL